MRQPKQPKYQMTDERKAELAAIAAAKDTEKLKAFIIDEKKIADDIKILNEPPIPEKEITREFKIEPKEPKVKIKTAPKDMKKEKIVMRPSPEQIHILVHTVAVGATSMLNKEDVTKEEDKAFSEVLYEVGDSLGWWNSMDFLPYLILLFSGIDLSLTIMKKPSKIKGQPKGQPEQIIQKVERQPDEKPNVLFDIVNEDALMEKLGGNNIYAAKTVTEETE